MRVLSFSTVGLVAFGWLFAVGRKRWADIVVCSRLAVAALAMAPIAYGY